jgi:hypothetical protein
VSLVSTSEPVLGGGNVGSYTTKTTKQEEREEMVRIFIRLKMGRGVL